MFLRRVDKGFFAFMFSKVEINTSNMCFNSNDEDKIGYRE